VHETTVQSADGIAPEDAEVPGDDRAPGLWTLIREDWETNGRDWTRPGFRAVAVHRFGNWRMRIRSRPIRWPLSVVYRVLYRFIRNHYGIELYYTVKLGRRLMIAHQGGVVIHDRTEIGDDCLIRHNVTIGCPSHRRLAEVPRIGNDVQIGAGAMVLGAITIGDGARIGANAVVTCDIPPGAKAVVEPARIITAERCRDDLPRCA
jgi:serine O-acetyltransferase